MSLLSQLKQVLDREEGERRDLEDIGRVSVELAQMSYALNCIWMYSHAEVAPPSRETLRKALPRAHDGSVDATKRNLEYIRKTLTVVRGLVSEKIIESVELKSKYNGIEDMLAMFDDAPLKMDAPQLEEEDIEEVVEEVVPRVCQAPKQEGEDAERKIVKGKGRETKRAKLPWIFT